MRRGCFSVFPMTPRKVTTLDGTEPHVTRKPNGELARWYTAHRFADKGQDTTRLHSAFFNAQAPTSFLNNPSRHPWREMGVCAKE